ncbi:MAG: sugar phosphate nucleotidyltransferase, partial [Bryobacteraceae bacterium]
MQPSVAILAGGLGTRLGPMTEQIPKALIRIGCEPFIFHQLRLLREADINRVVLCVGHLGDMICNAVGDGEKFGLNVAYAFDGTTLRGTAGAIKKALPQLGEHFFVLYGDSYLTCDFAQVKHAFEAAGKDGLMTVFRNQGQFDSSNVEFRDGIILRYDKVNRTPAMQHIDYGLGLFRANAFMGVPDEHPSDLASVYQALLAAGRLAAFEVLDRFYEIGSLQGIKD